MSKLYYEDTANWSYIEYGSLNSLFVKMFNYIDKYKDEINSMIIDNMSEQAKVILYCVITYRLDLEEIIKQFPNLAGLRDTKPLKKPICLMEHPFNVFKEYKEMNVLY